MKVKLISKTQGAGEFEGKSLEDIMVYAARVSSSRSDKFESPEGLLAYCIRNKHWSIFETGSLTFEIETSKAIGIQLLRHRSFTFQELSQRYANVDKMTGGDMFEPVEIRKQATDNRQSSEEVFDPRISLDDYFAGLIPCEAEASYIIENHLDRVKWFYNELLKAGVAREQARMILPMATKTRIFMTGNVRSWIHFIGLRDDKHAQKEAQEIARAIKSILIKEIPLISKAIGWTE